MLVFKPSWVIDCWWLLYQLLQVSSVVEVRRIIIIIIENFFVFMSEIRHLFVHCERVNLLDTTYLQLHQSDLLLEFTIADFV